MALKRQTHPIRTSFRRKKGIFSLKIEFFYRAFQDFGIELEELQGFQSPQFPAFTVFQCRHSREALAENSPAGATAKKKNREKDPESSSQLPRLSFVVRFTDLKAGSCKVGKKIKKESHCAWCQLPVEKKKNKPTTGIRK